MANFGAYVDGCFINDMAFFAKLADSSLLLFTTMT